MTDPSTDTRVAMTDAATLWAAKGRIFAIAVVAGLVGWGGAALLPPFYETEVALQIGEAFGRALDNPYALSARLSSKSYRSVLPEVGQRVGPDVLRTSVIEGAPGAADKVPALLQIFAGGRTAEDSLVVAKFVVDRILEDHKVKYDALVEENRSYQRTLEAQIEAANRELTRMESTLRSLGGNPGVSAPAVLLLQSQLEARQVQAIEYASRLRDTRVQEKGATAMTRVDAEPAPPRRPIWPPKALVGVIAAGIAALIAVLVLLLGGGGAAPAARG